jgi:hypothetical protein
VQRAQYHFFYQGDKLGLMRIAETALEFNPNNHFLMGMLAFGLEQCDRFIEYVRVWDLAIAIILTATITRFRLVV